MQVYTFTVVLMGKDVQYAADVMRDRTIEAWNNQYINAVPEDVMFHVTPAARATS